jgi:IS30 family transposase
VLHPDQVKLCELLKEGMNVSEVSRAIGKPRPTIYDELKRIREIFHKEGLDDFL